MARRIRRLAYVVGVSALLVGGIIFVRSRAPHRPPPFQPGLVAVSPWIQNWPTVDDEAVRLFATPAGTGTACSSDAPCSLAGARDHARTLTSTMIHDLIVQLGDGVYPVRETFALDGRDSGTHGHRVSYEAAAGTHPIVSGATRVGGWTLSDSTKGIYSASVDPALDTRQLFVNGVRATRARGETFPKGWSRTVEGFTAPDDSMAAWRASSGIEIVDFKDWKSLRCPVAAVEGRSIVMANPCWKNANAHDLHTMTDVTWVENAYELLDEPGEWYLDRAAGRLSYKPRVGEDLANATVVVATTETLVSVVGTREQPVHDVGFRGIEFAYNTWLSPSTPVGYPVLQAGWHLGLDEDPPNERNLDRLPGAIRVSYATNLRFERNTFVHLGGTGLDFAAGSQRVAVVGNRFDDLSGHGIQIGETAIRAELAEKPDQLDGFEVSNNVVEHIGVEYFDTVGIFVSYASNVSLLHNEIMHLPYSGISLGWGWGTDSYAHHNIVQANHVADVMRVLSDGGAVYTLSAQPDSAIVANYVHDQRNLNGGLYLDEGSQHFTVANNVVERVPRWLHIWTPTIRDNVVVDNYSDTNELMNEGTNITLEGNQTGLSTWPPGAQEIIAQAGLEPAYRNVRPG